MRRLGRFMKIGLALTLCLCMLCVTAKADTSGTFPDIPEDSQYAEAVEVLAELGIFQGDAKGNFNPDNSITRAEATAVICRLLGVEEEAKSMTQQIFSDVPSSHWAVGNIAKAAELGIVNGYGNGCFGPSDSVTQEQIIKMLVCAWGYEDAAAYEGGYPTGYIKVASNLGILEDIENIQGECPRKNVAILCFNMLFVPQASDE